MASRKSKSTLADLGAERADALREYAAIYGARWRAQLTGDWLRASYPGMPKERQHLLQQIRNQFGPTWLRELPEDAI